MKSTPSFKGNLFEKIVLRHPKTVLGLILIFIAFMSYQAKNFRLDASADTLILEDDQDLRNTRDVAKRYGEQNFVVVTYTPKADIFSPETLQRIALLQDGLNALEGVSSVLSLLDVPLLESPPIPLKALASNIVTLRSPKVDLALAKIEFQNSPIYQNLIVSPDLKTTALQVLFPVDQRAKDLLEKRTLLRDKERTGTLSLDEKKELTQVRADFQEHNDTTKIVRHQNIVEIRAVMDGYREDADLFLGGVSMIADDLITFIKKDLKLFGLGVLFFLILTLKIIFGQMRWILIPLLCCFFSTLAMAGFLGLFGWEVTVISSNFISLQLIITMAMSIHLIVRYRELEAEQPETEHKILIAQTVRSMFKPCLYAALTTIAGFASLVMSKILPVINFGWMMIAGITVSLILTFLIFPVVLILFDKAVSDVSRKPTFPLTAILANFTARRGTLILLMSSAAFVVSLIGISRLIVENSFIDYFKQSTEIYQGMKLIDQNLGGTTPLDIIIQFDTPQTAAPDPVTNSSDPNDGFDGFDDFDDFDDAGNADKYWFTEDKMAQIKKINAYLDGIPETGKVLSLGTMLQVAEKLNDGKALDNFELAVLYEKLPPDIRALVLTPYVSIENNQARFAIRVRDSEPTLKRDDFLKKIEYDLVHSLGLKPENIQITGMMVLYNNMLQSLFDSQIKTLGVTVSALLLMFLILFRSLKFSLIAIMPNLLSIGIVLGMMGWLGIPLDMMTITIAAISVGIAVDDTIHYIHRFKSEFEKNQNYIQSMYRCHASIGHAMYYTSITIVIGFSILTLSNFIPSIYFGLLTGLAMVIALIAAMTLLPQLIILIKPLGPEGEKSVSEGL